MPEYTFYNALYQLPVKADRSGLFDSIWKVQADPSYRVPKESGFEMTGLFITGAGLGVVRVAGEQKDFRLPPNSLFIIRPHVRCYYECPADGSWDFYFIRITDAAILDRLGLSPHRVYTCTSPDLVPRTGEVIINELIHERTGFTDLTDVMVRELLVNFARERDSRKGTEITDLIQWMHYNLHRPLTVEKLQKKSGMGRTALFTAFKKRTGAAPLSYFFGLKLDSARLLLETTGKKVYEIARDLSFYDEYHFSKLFKKKFGMPPGRWRKEHRGK